MDAHDVIGVELSLPVWGEWIEIKDLWTPDDISDMGLSPCGESGLK